MGGEEEPWSEATVFCFLFFLKNESPRCYKTYNAKNKTARMCAY